MIDQEQLRDLTESYLKSLIAEVSEVSGASGYDFDSFAPFGELGIDSFYVLKIIRRLEADFGRLPKSLLFEHFNINDLATYFVAKHEQTLTVRFSGELQGASAATADRHVAPVVVLEPPIDPVADSIRIPIRILESDAYTNPELSDLVRGLYARYKIDACVSRGTRKIGPNLFIGSARLGYFNYGRSRNLILVYGYTGPQDYLPVLLEEIYRYCETNEFQLNVLSGEEIQPIAGVAFSATPFGAMQRILKLREFTLDGGPMRRLRYQVSKFQKSGLCRTEDYRCGTNPETDAKIASVIDRWSEARTMVNPLVHAAKAEILAGTLSTEHRLFLTYLDDVLQNVILITPMSAEENGYLMDLEFYPPDMPLGGLEFAIVQIIAALVAEGCDVLSLGGTYGCKLADSASADPEIDRILDELREQDIFNDHGNLQFKNKFRPENSSIFLCRPVGSGNADNVIDIIMMIADPDKMKTSEEENFNFGKLAEVVPQVAPQVTQRLESPAPRRTPVAEPSVTTSERLVIAGDDRSRTLAQYGFNPLNIPAALVELDLKTDSWAQLEMPAIEAQMRHLHGQLQQPVNVDESLRAVFPFSHFVLTASGQAAEHIFFKAWPRQGIVLQNLLFPSTIFHQIDKGFTPREMPCAEVFQLTSQEPYKGNMSWNALQAEVARDPAAVAFVCIEVGNNAAGGYSVSIPHLRDVKALLTAHSIPLVIDATRVVENAALLIEQEKDHAGRKVWDVVREILSFADAVIGSLTKDFCVNKGGIIATNDAALLQRLQDVARDEGGGLDLIDRKLIALSLRSRDSIEARVRRRIEGVRRIWSALQAHGVPVVQPAGGHCVLVDVKAIAELEGFAHPVASFVAWLYLSTGIRAGAHSVGMQKHTPMNDLVRLAIPVGLKPEQIDRAIERLLHAFASKTNIPEIVMESGAAHPLGAVHANYRLVRYHNVSGDLVPAGDPVVAPPVVHTPPPPSRPPPEKVEPAPIAASTPSRRTQDIAIVGMAGRYPKAKNLGELWQNLAQGRDCIEEIPAERYERRRRYGSSRKYRGGFIDDVDKFDSLFFNISPREAEMLDPQERLLLEVAWEAIEDAGYYPDILAQEDASRNIGVFVGAVWAMYQMLGVEAQHASQQLVPNSFLWSIANRVSYWFNLSGPSLTVDTACSSSLTALYLACEAIQAGQCSSAIVGGVNLDLHQAKLDINMNGGALSADGVCRSFGKGANGYVAGEGIGALVLKALDRAVQDGDNIYGVIKSAVVNHGGRTSGYTVPNPKAQAGLITAALEKANIDARSIGYIEAHGTGTELGDPLEITGLSNAFQPYAVANQTCAIGSVKTNIGHLEAAAGVVSISKVLLQMKHRQLVPSLHSRQLNEFIDFKTSPFYVVQRLQEWKAKEVDGVRLPLRAGISSFGAGGANAHVILESYEAAGQASAESTGSLIFPLSARNEEQLRETAVRLVAFLQENEVDLLDAAYTLQHGRKSFEQRVAVIAGTREELVARLGDFILGRKNEDVAAGHAKGGEGVMRLLNRKEKQEFIRLVSQGRDPHKIAGLWAEGMLADWQGFPSAESAKRASLPTYPFADKRHWAGNGSPAEHAVQSVAGVHPMVDTNESTFERQLFKKTFHERDFFIYDHLVSDIPTLPGVAYLELVRKAGELAAGRKVRKIRNILWVSPIAVQNSIPKEVFIELKPSGESVQFEVFSESATGSKMLHSQGKLLYETREDAAAEPESIDLDAIRARSEKVTDGNTAYPLFKAFGLNLGPSFQVLQDVYKNENETLGVLKLPEFRMADLDSMVLPPSLLDGSLQAGMGAQLSEKAGEMFVPFSIGEVEILHPLQPNCFSYITEVKDKTERRDSSRVLKSNVLIVDETGKVLVKIRESVGVPLREVHKKPAQGTDADGFSRLYYGYDWEDAPLAAAGVVSLPPAVVLFASDKSLSDRYRERLREAGTDADRVIVVQPGDAFRDLGEQSYSIDPRNKDDFAQLFGTLLERGYAVENVCFAWPVGTANPLQDGVYAFLSVCQGLIRHKLENKTQLLYIFTDAQPHNEAVGGFVNALRLEHPRFLCKTLEVRQEEACVDGLLDAMAAELNARTQDATAVRYSAQGRSIRKLKAFDVEVATPAPAIGLREGGVYLITGGAGGLGLIFAEFLATEYKAKLVLTGRSTLSAEQEARLGELRKSGAEVLYLSADVSNENDVKTLIAETRSRFGQLHGIIHAAGVLRDSFVREKTADEMAAVFAPKVHGTLHLDQHTSSDELDFFVTFSSLAAVAGN
ncbi:MAG TPA: SDR family NAD(P)-dependent oxidoreductase, partial [Thermoanaerobaculia bacterium]|nr:SDR family NAD(P)-dependent oxidoreductase [Thermoanaerobaculia bacterium]